MARHHVNPNTGNPGICKASKAGCPFGGESGEENHYKTADEANQAAEKLMADQHSAINTAYRKKDSSALDGMHREMKKRIIAEAASGSVKLHPSVVAKVFSKDNDELIRKNVSENFKSQKILREMSTDESARVRLAVAKATNNPDVLKAFANDPDPAVRKAAIANERTPVKARKAALSTLGVKKNTSGSASKPAEKRVKKSIDTPKASKSPAPSATDDPYKDTKRNIRTVEAWDRHDAFKVSEQGQNFYDDTVHVDADKGSFVVEVKKEFLGQWGYPYNVGDLVEIDNGEVSLPLKEDKITPEVRDRFKPRSSY